MVMFATKSIYADRSSGTTFTHWEVCQAFSHPCTESVVVLKRERRHFVRRAKPEVYDGLVGCYLSRFLCVLQVGSILFSVVVVTVHLEIASILDHWTPLHHLSIWFSVCACLSEHSKSVSAHSKNVSRTALCPPIIILQRDRHCVLFVWAGIWILYLLLYGVFPLSLSQAIYHLFVEVLARAPVFWLILLLTPFACVLPGFFFRQAYRCCHPSEEHPWHASKHHSDASV